MDLRCEFDRKETLKLFKQLHYFYVDRSLQSETDHSIPQTVLDNGQAFSPTAVGILRS
jgi:hypothetical protein